MWASWNGSRAAGAVALLWFLLCGVAYAEAPKVQRLWSTAFGAAPGFTIDRMLALAVHADGTAMAAFVERSGPDGAKLGRLAVVAVAPDGTRARHGAPAAALKDIVGSAALVAEANGFALAASVGEATRVTVYRLDRDGGLRAAQRLRIPGWPLYEIAGLAADGRGNLLLHGGVNDGPHAPGLFEVDSAGRIAWYYAGPYYMPPGMVPAARFRRDGGNDAVVVDREKPSWERRSPTGALLARAPLAEPHHWDCRSFLDDDRLVNVFFSFAAGPSIKLPAKRWVLAVNGPDGAWLPHHVVLDLPGGHNALCKIATNEAGWIAIALGPPKIAIFDATLTLRGVVDTSPGGKAWVVALAIDARGAVTALLDAGPPEQSRRLPLVQRFAAVAP